MVPVLAVGVAAVLLAAGCGGKSTTTTTESTADWANGLCSSITTWQSSVNSAVSSVNGGNVSKSTLQKAADQVTSATQTLADSVKSLGKPNTDAGAKAKQAVDQLSTEISSEQQKIKTAISGVTSVSDVITAAPVVLGSLKTMSTEISSTFAQLKKLDASGELSSAFNQADACKTLNKSG
jgi:hypothetical protein